MLPQRVGHGHAFVAFMFFRLVQDEPGMSFDAWLTLGLTAIILVLLVRDSRRPTSCSSGHGRAAAVRRDRSKMAFAGFANPGVIMIGDAVRRDAGLQETGLMEAAGQRLLGRAKTETGASGGWQQRFCRCQPF